MAYCTLAQYTALFGANSACNDVLLDFASDMIDAATGNAIIGKGGFTALPIRWQNLVEKACAAQALFIIEKGGVESWGGGEGNSGFTVGRVSVSGGSSASGAASGAKAMLSPLAMQYLSMTGLLYRGREVIC